MSILIHLPTSARLLSGLAAIATIAPIAASAQESPVFVYGDPSYVRSERVSFARLDLTTPRDQKRLNHRVGAAVERVCLRDIGRDGLQDRGYYSCADTAWNKAVPQIADATRRASELAMNGSATVAATAIIVSAS